MYNVRRRTLVILGILFVFYVVGDLVTTAWLIDNHPGGIEGESNPLGILLYNDKGIFGLIVGKLILFIAIAGSTILTEAFFKRGKWMRAISKYTLIGLVAWSVLVVSINMSLIYSLSIQQI